MCNHSFCLGCLNKYLMVKLNSLEILSIPCPQINCGCIVSEEIIQKVLADNQFKRYKKFKTIANLNLDPSVRCRFIYFIFWLFFSKINKSFIIKFPGCPTADCETFIHGSKDRPCIECPKCSKRMCFLCNSQWHEGN